MRRGRTLHSTGLAVTSESLTENEAEAPGFEESLAELQRIVSELESGALGLEESLGRFEQGVGLLRRCHQTLERAEQKIELLTGFDSEGRPTMAPFDATATAQNQGQTAGRRSRKKSTKESPPAEESAPAPPESKHGAGSEPAASSAATGIEEGMAPSLGDRSESKIDDSNDESPSGRRLF